MMDKTPICPSCNADVIEGEHTGLACAWWKVMSQGDLFASAVRPDPHVFQMFCPCDACFSTLQHLKTGSIVIDTYPTVAMDSKVEEDEIKELVDNWPEQKQAMIYKYLYLLGMRIDHAERIVRKGNH